MNLLTPQEVASKLRNRYGEPLTEQAIYLAIRQGRLSAITILGRMGITKEEFERFKKSRNGHKKAA